MGPIQSGINQSLAILSLASSQSPRAQTVRRNTAETELGKQTVKASDKYYQGAQKSVNKNSFGKAPSVEFVKPEAAKEAFELKQKGLNQQLEAAKERGDYKSIESLNKEIAGLEENKSQYGLDGEEEQHQDSEEEREFYANEAMKEMQGSEMRESAAKGINQDYRDRHHVALDELNRRLSAKKRIKVNMNMMKSALKEDN